jgi:hypothetical protein
LFFLAPSLVPRRAYEPPIKNDCTHAYVGKVVLVAIFMLPFIAVMHGQELPDAPQAVIKHQIPPVDKQTPLLAKPVNPIPGSADWFRERGYFKLARIVPILLHIHLNPVYDKPKRGRPRRP